MPSIAPEIFRQRLLIEGYFDRDANEEVIRAYLATITRELNLRTYGEPTIHKTSGQGRPENEGFDAFVPLIDSGIYVGLWSGPHFVSTIIYTCAAFDEQTAIRVTRDFFRMDEFETASF